ncbi:MAG: AAA family ATPase [Serratia fonticola]
MPPARQFGASADEWFHFAYGLGLLEDLLPVVSNPDAAISPYSTLKKVGKTPSVYNEQGLVAGFTSWTSHQTTDSEFLKWSKQPDYGICVQTRSLRAIDVDVTDPADAEALYALLSSRGLTTRRARSDSSKFLCPFWLHGDFTKRSFAVANDIVEFLATGQQFIAVGTNPSGARYSWGDRLPAFFPSLSAPEFEALWGELSQLATNPPTTQSAPSKQAKIEAVFADDPVVAHLRDTGRVLRAERDGKIHLTCPFADQHTTESSVSATTYFPAHTGGYANGHFQCQHAHCAHRTDQEFLDALGFVSAAFEAFPILTAPPAQASLQSASQPVEPHRFHPIPAKDYAGTPRANWIIKHVLPHGEMGVIFGASGSGKTFAATDLAAHVAAGLPWRGHKTTQGRVVYVAAEGAGGFKLRLSALDTSISLDGLPLDVIPAAPSLLDRPEAVDLAKTIAAGGKTALVVIDTLAQTTAGGDENSGRDLSTVIQHCQGIHKATGAMVLLVHHSGKDASKGARGHSSLRGAADVEIEVVKDDQDRRMMKLTKQKDGIDSLEWPFALQTVELGFDEDGDPITSCVVVESDAKPAPPQLARTTATSKSGKAVMGYIQTHFAMGVNVPLKKDKLLLSVARELGSRTDNVRRTLTALASEGAILIDADDFVALPEKENRNV